jgi:hypothetical protein
LAPFLMFLQLAEVATLLHTAFGWCGGAGCGAGNGNGGSGAGDGVGLQVSVVLSSLPECKKR